MEKISNQHALEKIKGLGIAYVMEYDALNYLIEDEEDVECYVNDEMLITYNPSQDTTYIGVLPLGGRFDIEELLTLVKSSTLRVSLLVNIQSLEGEFLRILDERLSREFDYEYTLVDYVHTATMDAKTSEGVRLLGPEDKEAFVCCSKEQIKNRPPLAVLFDIFVNRRQGQILAFFREERIVGYLSFNTVADQVHDVDYIYVTPESRNQGIGSKLATAYARYAHDHGYCAYWSNAKNEASAKTAESCGFSVIRRASKFVSSNY